MERFVDVLLNWSDLSVWPLFTEPLGLNGLHLPQHTQKKFSPSPLNPKTLTSKLGLNPSKFKSQGGNQGQPIPFHSHPQGKSLPFLPDPDPDPDPEGSSASFQRMQNQVFEDGVEVGVYKAILVGIVGPSPVQKSLKNGMKLTLMTVGTGGIKNNRRPLVNEDPGEYANRSSVLWHRVAVYQPNLGNLIIKNVEPGNMVYVEGNIETKVFTDAITGLVRRVREVALRKNGRFVFLGKGDSVSSSPTETRNAGYY